MRRGIPELAAVLVSLAGWMAGGQRLANPFFAFDNGVGRGSLTPDAQAELLSRLGYAGIGYTGTKDIPEMLGALDRRGLKLFSIYVGADLDAEPPAYDPGLPQAVEQLKGRDTLILLYLTGKVRDSDARAIGIVRAVSDLASGSGLRVALYPHVGFDVATVQDAVRVARAAGRKNVGVMFNLCHFLKAGDEPNLLPRLREAMPLLLGVSINGADHEGGWDRLIQTLDRGEFDVANLLDTLQNLGYKGPIGLQCYNIPGDLEDNLARSMKAWRQLSAR